MCVTSVEQAEVSSWANLPHRFSLLGGSNRIRGSRECTFVDGQTFFVGTVRANYQCDPTYWRNLKGARQDEEYLDPGWPDADGYELVQPNSHLRYRRSSERPPHERAEASVRTAGLRALCPRVGRQRGLTTARNALCRCPGAWPPLAGENDIRHHPHQRLPRRRERAGFARRLRLLWTERLR